MISQEEKVSQALCFGSLVSHSPFLMERPSKDLCSSNMNIELPFFGPFPEFSLGRIWAHGMREC